MNCYAFRVSHFLGEFIGIVPARSEAQAAELAKQAWGDTHSLAGLTAEDLANMTREGGLPVFTAPNMAEAPDAT